VEHAITPRIIALLCPRPNNGASPNMVVVRESPRARISPDKNRTAWPPRSPFEALMASPTGKKRWEDDRRRDQERSPSPSPLRRPMSSSKALQDVAMADDDNDDEDDVEEEDEETLQLKLQQIEMKLKLKRLKGKKKSPDSNTARSSSALTDSSRRSPTKLQAPISQPLFRRPDIEVPVSPTRERRQILDPVSPARARLGLSTVPKAQDVSLKRARDGTIKPSSVQRAPVARAKEETIRPVSSFSERLAKSRQEQQEQQARNDRIERSRSNGFGLQGGSFDSQISRGAGATNSARSYRSAGERLPSPTKSSSAAESRSRMGPPSSSAPQQNNPFLTARSQDQLKPTSDGHDRNPHVDESDANIPWDNKKDGNGYDPFSGIHLSKRHIAHVDAARAMEGSELYPLPRLLKEVKAPEYDPPDCESDYIVFGILAKKSTPYNHKQTHRTNDQNNPQEDASAPRNKFMVMTLVDLKWEIDLFLFGTAFDQFWKLTEGTLLAIQNPAILPPKGNQNNGRFSLKLGSSEDRVMELGVARDLGYCVSVKKDGEKCGAWIDKRSTQVCDFHLNLMIDKSRKGRMEVNTMWRSGSLDEKQAGKRKQDPSQFKKKIPGQHAGEHGRVWSVDTGFGKSAANIFDGEDRASVESLTAEEASRKRIAAAQRERDLAKKLESMGGSVGADYLRARQTTTTTTVSSTRSSQEKTVFEKPSASELGLLGNKAHAIRLSPAKDRKRHFGTAAISSAGTEALGWGGAKKYGLLLPKPNRIGSPERGQTTLKPQPPPPQPSRSAIRPASQDSSTSPRKRARFALERGIREPGRESLGTAAAGGRVVDDDDDDDDLDIV
jgi:minichromosome maintenance protein 10